MGPDAELEPDLILEGTLQRLEDRLRIRYRLVDQREGVAVAGQEVEGSAANLFGLQDSVAVRVVWDLRSRHRLDPAPAPEPRPTADLAAYDYYLRARGHLYRLRDRGDLESAADHFRRALDLDPGFALARAGPQQNKEKRAMADQASPTFDLLVQDGTVMVEPSSRIVPKGSLVRWRFVPGVEDTLLGRVVFPDASVVEPGDGLVIRPGQPAQTTAAKSGQHSHSVVVWRETDPPMMAAAILIIEDP